MQPTDITCGAVVLQPWTEQDVDALVAGRNDPEVVRWTGSPFPYTREHAERYIGEETPQWWAEGSAATWAVRDATTGAVLGAAALHGIKDGEAADGLAFAGAEDPGEHHGSILGVKLAAPR